MGSPICRVSGAAYSRVASQASSRCRLKAVAGVPAKALRAEADLLGLVQAADLRAEVQVARQWQAGPVVRAEELLAADLVVLVEAGGRIPSSIPRMAKCHTLRKLARNPTI